MANESLDRLSTATLSRAMLSTAMEDGRGDAREIVIPLHEEEISVSRRVIPKSRVRVSTATRLNDAIVDELLAHEEVVIERKTIDKRIDAMPPVREEGSTIIIPVVEEVLVVERQLILKEEVHIRRVRKTERHQERVTLRKQEAFVTRSPVEKRDAAGVTGAGITEIIQGERRTG
jgi:uncharacterized protein (TIGR02271 family)